MTGGRDPTETTDDVDDRLLRAHLALHLREARIAITHGDLETAATSAILAATMIELDGRGEDVAELAVDLGLGSVDTRPLGGVSVMPRLGDRARATAQELRAHFTSEGRLAEADLYARVAEGLTGGEQDR